MITDDEGQGFLQAVEQMLAAAVDASGASRDRILDSLFRWLCRPYDIGRRRRLSAFDSLNGGHKLADDPLVKDGNGAGALQRSDSTTLYVSAYVCDG